MRFQVRGDVIGTDHHGSNRGIKIEVPDLDLQDVEDLKKVGEWARGLVKRFGKGHEKVWLWIYGPEMDIQGPAVCLAYWRKGEGSKVEFTPFEVVAMWTLGQIDPGEPVPVQV